MSELLNQRYQITQELARGSDSQVWQGLDTRRQLPVLIKAYLPHALQDWKRLQLIEREARILAQINHIEIPGFVDFFALGPEGQQTLYLVTHWVNGQSLSDKLAQGWRPDVDEVFEIASKTLELLIYIHAFNPPLVHRDIKPSNLMVNQWMRVYLVDFGGAQEALSSQGAGGSTLVGTVGYMAPEQLQGRAVPGTDLYGLGATLLQLLTREAPAEAGSEAQKQQLESLAQGLPKDLQRWLTFLLDPNPDQRYASAEEALRDLDQVRDKDFSQRHFFYPQNHLAQIPEIIHSLTITERSAEDQALLQGSLLEGRYEVDALLGAGTHSRVYSGQIRHSGQKIILKELCIEQVSEWKNIELFEREMDIQQRLKHPRIPAYIDSFQIQEADSLSWFLITEAVDGETLDQRLERGWRPTDEVVWALADQLLDILEYLHSQDPPLVHRDIKPSNVLITEDNQIWLIDFGAVQNRLWAQGGGGSTIIGTFGYMAPEQFSGQAWPQSDLYGLGATLIRLLSRRHPIEIPLEGTGLNFQPFVSCEAFYLAWLSKLLQPLHSQRFASAREARILLRDALQNGQRARDWLQQNKPPVPQTKQQSGRRRFIPPQLTLDAVPTYLRGTQLVCDLQTHQLVLNTPLDSPLRQSLLRLDRSMHLFPRDPDNGANHPLLIFSILLGISIGVVIWMLMLYNNNHITELVMYLGCATAPGLFFAVVLGKMFYGYYLQGALQILPLEYDLFYPSPKPVEKQHRWESPGTLTELSVPELLVQASFSLNSQGLTLHNQNLPGKVKEQCCSLKWSELSQLNLTPWQPEVPWERFMHFRLYRLTFYPPRSSSYGSSEPADKGFLLPLAPEDAEVLLQILKALQAQYTTSLPSQTRTA